MRRQGNIAMKTEVSREATPSYWADSLFTSQNGTLQDLERQLEDLTQQMQDRKESVRIQELESERRLAEERIAELESQLAGDQLQSGGMLPVLVPLTFSHCVS